MKSLADVKRDLGLTTPRMGGICERSGQHWVRGLPPLDVRGDWFVAYSAGPGCNRVTLGHTDGHGRISLEDDGSKALSMDMYEGIVLDDEDARQWAKTVDLGHWSEPVKMPPPPEWLL